MTATASTIILWIVGAIILVALFRLIVLPLLGILT